jgi:hypothetical protein
MTKARDIASAAPAPSGVTATELGYVDGVTSAIQTQVDAKIAKTLTTTTGDIIYASGANTPARLGVGSTGNVLTVSGGVPAWAAPAGGGKVLQVVQATTSTAVATSTTLTFVDTGLTGTITPTLATSKILVMTTQTVHQTGNLNDRGWNIQLVRGSTVVYPSSGNYNSYLSVTAVGDLMTTTSVHYLDSPATTSATTYKTQMNNVTGRTAVTTTAQVSSQTSTMILLEIGA